MTFARPEFLWLFWTVGAGLLFAVLGAIRRRRAMSAIGQAGPHPGRRIAKSGLFLGGLTLLVLAGAGPRIGTSPVPPTASGPLRLIIALDCSRSMLVRDLAPDRLTAAKKLLLDVLAGLPRVEVGLVGFAGRAWLACPVTADRAALARFLDAMGPDEVPLGGTNPAAALEACRLALAGAERGAALLVTDGEATTVAGDAAGTWPPAWPLLTVAVGGPTPVPIPDGKGGQQRDAAGAPVLVGMDAGGLAALAARSDGQAYRLSPDAPPPAQAIAAFLAALVPARDVAGTVAVPNDRTNVFLLAALVLLLLDTALPATAKTVLAALLLAALPAATAQAASSAADNAATGVAAWERGDNRLALDAFLAARVRDPDNPAILYDIGTAAYRLGDFARAEAAFDRAARAAPPPLAAKARYNQGNAAYRRGDAMAAIRCYEAALALAPNDADARANLDWLRAQQQRQQPQSGEEHGQETQHAGSASGSGDARATGEGKAPSSPQGNDDGSGTARENEASDNVAGPPDAGQNGPPESPAAAPQGQAAGIKRADAAGRADDPVLDRIPDLPGLPRTPQYGRPAVEKDW